MILSLIKKYFFQIKLKKKYPKVIFGSNFTIEDKTLLHNLEISEYVYIGANANWSLRGEIKIGTNVIFGPETVLWPYNHNYNSLNFIPYGPKNEDIVKGIHIEDNVWIGRGVLILAGVKIGEGAVIGANSVLTKDIPSCAIAAGNPAKIIKYRDQLKYLEMVKEGKFYLKYKMI